MSEVEMENQSTGEAELGLTEQSVAADGSDSIGKEDDLIELPGIGKLSKEEVAKGYLRQQDYTQKTQTLAESREEYNRLLEEAKALRQAPAPTNEWQDPERAETEAIKSQLASMSRIVGKMEAEKLLDKINNDPKYRGVFKEKAMEDMLLATHLQKGRGSEIHKTAEEVFKVISKLQLQTEQATEKKVVENLASPTRKAPTGTGGGIKTPPKDFDPSKSSWKDLAKIAKQMI